MKTSDFMYNLPERLIAQSPVEPRDHSRLMVVDRANGAFAHRRFYDLPNYLTPGDALVLNETRVLPARLIGERERGGACEVLLLRQTAPKTWEALVKPGRRLKCGAVMRFGGGRLTGTVLDETAAGGRVVAFECEGSMESALDELGEMPLPHYIHEVLKDKNRYQTVYARRDGSAAAPTAGLHFTPELLRRIADIGVDIIPVLLHVGLGTFRPVQAESIEDHVMRSEYYEIGEDAAARVNAVKRRGGRVFAVGTTSVRTLESAANGAGTVAAGGGWTDIFIKPGNALKIVDGLITNFHLPGSTLIMLVSAMLGVEATMNAYSAAVADEYRFFSFGDAMLIAENVL